MINKTFFNLPSKKDYNYPGETEFFCRLVEHPENRDFKTRFLLHNLLT